MKIIFVVCFCLLYHYFQGFSHPMPNTIVEMYIYPQKIRMDIKIPLTDMFIAYKKNIPKIPDAQINKDLQTYFTKHIHIQNNSKNNEKITFLSYNINETNSPIVGKYEEIHFLIEYTSEYVQNKREIILFYDAILHEIANHQALVILREDWENGFFKENPPISLGTVALDIPTNTILPISIQLEKGSPWKSFKSMIFLGIKHIQEGTDHIFFLLTLLIVAPLTKENNQWKQRKSKRKGLFDILKIITSFTIGHSITLLLGSMGIVSFSSNWIEVLVAFTLFISAFHTIKPIFPEKEYYIVFFFGSIHGMAFSYTLSHIPLNISSLLSSILGFNIGIEIMQFIIIILAFPCLFIVAQYSFYKHIRNILGTISLFFSTWWIYQRIQIIF
ncbi:MAG: HupE/UreJ family protein [Chitinophagaceae bacterium]|nr:HupE/UreJ family protein [Chitinophagaceae bacterium]